MQRLIRTFGTIAVLIGLGLSLTSARSADASESTGPLLWIPDDIPAQYDSVVTVPVNHEGNGNSIAALTFSIDFDQTWLTFDPTDNNNDGVPDAIHFTIPSAFGAGVTYDSADIDGELDFLIADTFPPLTGLPSGTIVTMDFGTRRPPVSRTAFVNFSNNPLPSFGNTAGQSVPGTYDNGSVRIQGCCDFNNDGQVTVIDIQMVASCWRQPIGGSCQSRYDVDRDGNLDIVDIQRVAGVLTS